MRTQPPTSPFDVVGVGMARYGEPQHETAVSSTDTFYGPPQHEQHVEDPDWLISIARRSFSINSMEPFGEPETESEPEPKSTDERPRERAVLGQ
ncbi:hypothetical protein halTADL_2050 [Halohasta litchfieldiae]|uniref:Uncharacterized protein n=1 Tax=Halohasta litchfieldiae TaxID=1073996 RepID=A0A1H6TMN1_9EURY|nr:hypothetical protein [Halohasta litchfieldiae]ATW88797.1 hypothetical protein halTADL_2050 [Halohasta litchfieldiae]SEI78427.1 hypothetical protein SAMN05444271_10810 [Halohasta litchfieldiae]